MKQIIFFIVCISLIPAAYADANKPDANAQLIQAAKDGKSEQYPCTMEILDIKEEQDTVMATIKLKWSKDIPGLDKDNITLVVLFQPQLVTPLKEELLALRRVYILSVSFPDSGFIRLSSSIEVKNDNGDSYEGELMLFFANQSKVDFRESTKQTIPIRTSGDRDNTLWKNEIKRIGKGVLSFGLFKIDDPKLTHIGMSTKFKQISNIVSKEADPKVASADWRSLRYPPDSKPLPMFSDVGAFDKLPNTNEHGHIDKDAHARAERIVSDEKFVFSRNGLTLNLWAILEQYEGAFGIDALPHTIWKVNDAAQYIAKKYGKPDATSIFRREDGTVLNVYWYGPIFIIADSKEYTYEYGGWPSRINQPVPTPKSILPAYDWRIVSGDNSLTIHNPNDSGVVVGIRSKDTLGAEVGVDWRVEKNTDSTFNLPLGRYNVFIVFDDKPKTIFQGDAVELKLSYDPLGNLTRTHGHVYLTEQAGGNYNIRQVK